MLRSVAVITLTLLSATVGLATPSVAADTVRSETELRAIERRAVEAVIWGLPAVNYDLMLQEMLTKTTAKVNEIVYWSEPVTWKNQTLTPNPDALYFMIFFDTRSEPVVIDVPPAEGGSFAANIDTVWQMPLEDAGPYGADAGKGGKYLILPPGYDKPTPEGYIALKSETFAGFALFRSDIASHSTSDLAKSLNYGKRLKVYPLSTAASARETKFTDAKDVLYDSTIPYDIRFFQSLDRIIQSEPWQTRDKAMIDQLRSIGIEKGKAFNPDAATVDMLNAAAVEAHRYLEEKYDQGYPPFFPTSRWAVPAFLDLVKAGSSGYAETDIYPVDARALTYSMGYVGIKRLGTAQTYLIASKDNNGKPLEGGANYRLRVPPNVPVKQYWSVTVYDRETHALVRNMDRASRASNAEEVAKNADGSVDIFFGPNAPDGKETNWVPTDPKRNFELLFRLYAPEKALFDRAWTLPDVEKLEVQ